MGFDGSGTHGGREIVTNEINHNFANAIADKIMSYPSSCEVCSQAYLALVEYLKKFQKDSKSPISVLLKKQKVVERIIYLKYCDMLKSLKNNLR
jgi:hypothetical protein